MMPFTNEFVMLELRPVIRTGFGIANLGRGGMNSTLVLHLGVSTGAARPPRENRCMPAAHRPGLRVTSGVTIPESELSWRFSRSSGPGGQGVNTADSRVELSWDVTGSAALSAHQRERLLERLRGRLVDGVLTIAASEHRAQLRNRDAARERLAAIVADALRPPAPSRRPTKPTRGAKERRLTAKKQRTDVKRLRRPPHD
jgi:ribosome-associated protein